MEKIYMAGCGGMLGEAFYRVFKDKYDIKCIDKDVNDEWLSYLVLFGEKFFFPTSMRYRIFKSLGSIKGKTILEYGCSIGSLTNKMSSSAKRIFATDLSLHNFKIN